MENAIPVEIERKYLIRLPEEELLLRLAVRRDAIEQTYLRSRTKDTTERVRLRGGVYTHTIKRRAGAYSHEEQEEVIDEAACRALLERADPALQTIRKTRWCIPYEGRMLELDVFPFWRSQAMLEIELRDEAEQPTLPPWVTLLREVSGDRRYSNRAMAAEPPKEDGSLRQSPIARTWAEVRLDRIEQNYRALSAALPEGCGVLGVVKANAYGHGALPVARRLQALHCPYLAVACVEEAAELREGGITLPILILGPSPAADAPLLAELGVTQAVGSLAQAQAYAHCLKTPLRVHAKLETGMGRTGFRTDRLEELLEAMRLPMLEFEGVFTHFAVSELPDEPYTDEQYARFLAAVEAAEAARGLRFRFRHCCNSGAVLSHREMAQDLTRPGLALYGMYPGAESGGVPLQPAMTLRSRVAAVTEHHAGESIGYGRRFVCPGDMRIAVVPIGYADGLHRALSGKLEAEIGGVRVPQLGSICMDLCMLDVTDLPDCGVGTEVTIFGGGVRIEELADKADTISYELVCALSRRVPRVYLG